MQVKRLIIDKPERQLDASVAAGGALVAKGNTCSRQALPLARSDHKATLEHAANVATHTEAHI